MSDRKPNDGFVSIAGAASLLNCSTRHVHRKLEGRAFPALRDGRRILIPRTAIEAYIASLPSVRAA